MNNSLGASRTIFAKDVDQYLIASFKLGFVLQGDLVEATEEAIYNSLF
jgi:hypothetical protein